MSLLLDVGDGSPGSPLPPVSPNWQLGIRPVVSESRHGKTFTFHEHLIHSLQRIYTSRYKCSFCRLCTVHQYMKGFIMSHSDQYGPDDLVQFEVNLDIPAFVRTAVRNKMKRDTILVYLHMVSQTYQATDKMRRFATVAQEEDLTRNEILIWLHLSYGGSMEPRHISRKLRIPPRFVEKALTVLEEKSIIKDGRAL